MRRGLGQIDVPAIASRILYEFTGGGFERELEALKPVQDQVLAWIYEVSRGIPNMDVSQLQTLISQARGVATDFRAFVADPAFSDGRAGRQVLDGTMPLLDGTNAAGDVVPIAGGGLVGQLQGAILRRGGQVLPPTSSFVQGAGGQSIDPAASYSLGADRGLPQSGIVAPSLTELWNSITGRTATGEPNPAAVQQQGALVQWLLVGGILYVLFQPSSRSSRRAGE